MRRIGKKVKQRLVLENTLGIKVCLPYFLKWLHGSSTSERSRLGTLFCQRFFYYCCHSCPTKEQCRIKCSDNEACERSSSPLKALRVFQTFAPLIFQRHSWSERIYVYTRLVRKFEESN